MVAEKEFDDFESDSPDSAEEIRVMRLNWETARRSVINPEDLEVIDAVLSEIAKNEEKAKEDKTLITEYRKLKRAGVRAAKKKLKEMDTRGLLQKDIRLKLEREVIEQRGAKRSAYRGGDYEGRDALIIQQNAEEIFEAASTFLCATDPEKRHVKCTNQMIDSVSKSYCRLIQYNNCIRYLARKPNGTATDEHINMMYRLVGKAVVLETKIFDTLTPKMRSKFDHLPEDFEEHEGIGDFTEDYQEQDHQQGKIDNEMTKGQRNRFSAFKTQAQLAERRNLVKASGISQLMLEATAGTKRKRKTIPDSDVELDMDEWIRMLLSLPELEYTYGSVNNIRNINRRRESNLES